MKKIITSLYIQPMYSCILVEPREIGEFINILYEYELEMFDELSKIDVFVSDEIPDAKSKKLLIKEKSFTIGDVDEKELYFSVEDEYIYVHWDIKSQYDGEITIYVSDLSSIQLTKQILMISNFDESISIESNHVTLDSIPNEIEHKDEYSFDISKLRYTRTLYIEYPNNVFDTQEYSNYLKFYNLVPPHNTIELAYNGDIRFVSYEESKSWN